MSHFQRSNPFAALSDEVENVSEVMQKQRKIYQKSMHILTDRVCIDETYEYMVGTGKPLLASELRILAEKMDDAFAQYEASKAKLEARYVENRKKHPNDIDYALSEYLRMEKDELAHIYEKYARKHDREFARKEGKLDEYEDELDQEWDDYNHNISMCVDRY